MKTHELVARFVKAAENADPMKSAREVLESLRSDIEAIEAALAYISGIGGNARRRFMLPIIEFDSGQNGGIHRAYEEVIAHTVDAIVPLMEVEPLLDAERSG